MQQQNKIYQLIPYYPPNLGGMQNCAQIIAQYFSQKGYKVTVLTSNIGYTKKNTTIVDGNLVIKYLKSIEIAHTPLSLQLFFELLKIPRDAIVHVHIANAFYPEMVSIISKIKGFRYIAHVHIDVQSSGIFGILLPMYKAVFLKMTLQHAMKIICLTDSFKVLMQNRYKIVPSNVVVIPNGVNKDFFIDIKEKNKNTNDILFVGRLSVQKNITMLLNAMPLLKNKALLHIVGDGDQKKEIMQTIKLLKLTNVKMHGLKIGKELLTFYKQATLFILPSKNEGMSLAMLEAMAAGLPIIATAIPQTKNFIKKGAMLIDHPTPSKFANAIDSLLLNAMLRKTMGQENQKIAKHFTWDSSLQQIEKIYKEFSV